MPEIDEDRAAEIVRRIVAAPSREAFDCAAGSIIRLFSSTIELGRRLAFVEKQTASLDALERRIVAIERAPLAASAPLAAHQVEVETVPRGTSEAEAPAKSNGHAGDDFRIPDVEGADERLVPLVKGKTPQALDRRHRNPGRPRGTPNKPGHHAGRPPGTKNRPKGKPEQHELAASRMSRLRESALAKSGSSR